MIRLSWLQFRAQALTAAAALAAFAILLATTGPRLASRYAASGITGCHGFACGTAVNAFLSQLAGLYPVVYLLGIGLILIAPAITGIFWGAPLIARELETGTDRLAWNQSITRARWLAVKLTLTGAAAMAVTEAFSLLQAWWAAPIGKAVGLGGSASIITEGRFGSFVFPTHGITPVGYAAFGFALGVTAGFVIQRAIPAMAVTLAIFAVIQLITPLWIRPHLLPAEQRITTIAAAGATAYPVGPTIAINAAVAPGHPGAWIISSAAVSTAGQPARLPVACESAAQRELGPAGSPALDNCLTSHGIRVAVSYKPVSRYWPLQFAETGLFLVLALALAWYCFWRLGRRLS